MGKGYSEHDSSIRAVAIVVGLVLKAIGWLLLLGLLVVSSLAWVWLASFRFGWRLGDWLEKQPDNQDKLALNILYGAIVAMISPLAFIGNWTQKLVEKIGEKFQIQCPPRFDLQKIIEEQLGIKHPKDSPCLPTKASASESASDADVAKI